MLIEGMGLAQGAYGDEIVKEGWTSACCLRTPDSSQYLGILRMLRELDSGAPFSYIIVWGHRTEISGQLHIDLFR